jgi:hypothetical protein
LVQAGIIPDDDREAMQTGDELPQQLQAFGNHFGRGQTQPRGVAAGLPQAFDNAKGDGIVDGDQYDRKRCARALRSERGRCSGGDQNSDAGTDQFLEISGRS